MESQLICLAVALIGGLMLSRLTKLLMLVVAIDDAVGLLLFAVLVYELIGPMLTKQALTKAGEIDPEGRTSARTHNQPKQPIHFR